MSDTRSFPDVEFCHKTADEIMEELVNSWESTMGRSLGRADPIRAMLAWEAAIDAQLYAAINETGKLNLPRYAYGDYLDSIAERYHRSLKRMDATAASTTVRFTLAQKMGYDVAVPVGTRVTQNGDVLFETTETAYIETGKLYVDVPAVCTENGEKGNGYLPGYIDTCVDADNVEGLSTVENLTETEGGSSEESDEEFYERMRESMEAYSTAGPSGSYIYHAKSASPKVGGVAVTSSERGYVDIYILRDDGELPGGELLSEVEDYLRNNDVRPMTDYVRVKAPEPVDFDIKITWFEDEKTTKSRESIEAEIEKALGEYQEWQTTEIGRDINPSYLIKLLMGTGIKRVEVEKPVFRQVGKYQVARLGTTTVTCGKVISGSGSLENDQLATTDGD